MSEITKVIQELDRDRIQDGKTSDILKQKYELLDERIENLSEAIIEINNTVNRSSKIQVDHNDLNIIKEACLQDFNTLNERINDVGETIDTLSKAHL
jgi:prefoldin subunit 5